jgi:hypothetical protein
MRRDPDFFGDAELVLIYIAKKLREALKLEEQLTAAHFEYLVEPDTYRGGLIFATERVGAFFYVQEERAEAAKAFLSDNKYKPYRTD